MLHDMAPFATEAATLPAFPTTDIPIPAAQPHFSSTQQLPHTYPTTGVSPFATAAATPAFLTTQVAAAAAAASPFT